MSTDADYNLAIEKAIAALLFDRVIDSYQHLIGHLRLQDDRCQIIRKTIDQAVADFVRQHAPSIRSHQSVVNFVRPKFNEPELFDVVLNPEIFCRLVTQMRESGYEGGG